MEGEPVTENCMWKSRCEEQAEVGGMGQAGWRVRAERM